ncbi:MAG: hypothetical protein QGD94_05360 [Planctomycetia bacterium]|nr:hypothetical protein [Planctomycetia bacterium]
MSVRSQMGRHLLRLWLSLARFRRLKPRRRDVEREVWKTSLQRLGLRVRKEWRDRFRPGWLRIYRGPQ